jgi:hypothetical protein
LPIEMRFDPSGNAIFTLRLPLHKRIGTQFKCFVTVRHADAIETVKQFLGDVIGSTTSRSPRA